MKKLLIAIILMNYSALFAKGVQLNLPERFEVEVLKEWATLNGKKVPRKSENLDEVILQKPTLYYNNGRIRLQSHQQLNSTAYGKSMDSSVPVIDDIYTKGEGFLNNGVFEGKVITTIDGDTLRGKFISNLKGKVEEGKLHIISRATKTLYYKIKVLHTKEGPSGTSKYGVWENENIQAPAGYQSHYLFQLPINQPQSAQTFTKELPQEPEPQELSLQPDTPNTTFDTQTPISASAGIETEPEPNKPTDPCKDPNQDAAMKEYCANKAYNAKLDAKEAEREKAQEESKAKARAEEEAKVAKAKEEEAYWKKQRDAYFGKQKEEALKRAAITEERENRAFHESIAKEQAERRAKQKEIASAHAIVDRFGEDSESQSLAHKKIEALSRNADSAKAKQIREAIKKQFYDSRQIKLQADAEYQTSKAKELDKSSKKAELIHDTSVAINKILVIPAAATASLGTIIASEAVSFVHSASINAYSAIGKDGLTGAGISLIKDTVNTVIPFNIGGDAIDNIYRKEQYYTSAGVEIPSKMEAYDKNGYKVTRIKSGDRVYNKKGEDITFSTVRRATQFNSWFTRTKADATKGNIGKKANAVLDSYSETSGAVDTILDGANMIRKLFK